MTNNPVIELTYFRDHKKISQKKLAQKLQISQGYISDIEKGKKSPTVRMLYRFAEALEICPRLLLPCIIKSKENFNCECELNCNDSCDI